MARGGRIEIVGLLPSRVAPSGAVQKDATLISLLTDKIAWLYDISPKLDDFVRSVSRCKR